MTHSVIPRTIRRPGVITVPIQLLVAPWWLMASQRLLSVGYMTSGLDSHHNDDTWVPQRFQPPAWASYQMRKIAGCACAGNAGNVFPRRRFQRKPLVGDPGMHHGTCVTHVPWCMSGSLICGDGENVPGIPGACAPATLRIWQEAHFWWCTKPNIYLIYTYVCVCMGGWWLGLDGGRWVVVGVGVGWV